MKVPVNSKQSSVFSHQLVRLPTTGYRLLITGYSACLLALCFATLLTGCGEEKKGNQGAPGDDSQGTSRADEEQIETAPVVSADQPEVRLPKKHLTLLENYCFDCHDADTQKGKVNLEALSFEVTTPRQAELWQKVLNSINAGEMPPEDKRQPKPEEKADFLADLADTMVLARKALSDSGGKITMARLNRREYQNTIEVLTGVKVDVESLPSDESHGTFDTVGSSLFISSDQFEQYLKIGRAAIDEAFVRRAAKSQSKTYRVEPETTINPANEKEIRAVEKRHAQFREWQKAVDKAAAAPENRKIVAKIRASKKGKTARGFYASANQLKGSPNPKDYGFRDAQSASASLPSADRARLPLLKHFASLPHRDRGAYLKLAHGTGHVKIGAKNMPPGTYVLRVHAGVVEGTPADRRFIDVGYPQRQTGWPRGLIPGPPLATRQITGSIKQPQTVEVRLEVGLNSPGEFAVQEKQPNDNLKALWPTYGVYKKKNGYGIPPAIWIDWVELEGPIAAKDSSPQFDWWVEKRTGLAETSRAREILENFAHRAFRGVAPEDDYLDALVTVFKQRRSAGEDFEVAIRRPLSVILASPGFLYRNEPSETGQRRSLNQRELAVRLAYFLWSAPPDEQLLALAEKKQLRQPEVLRRQVTRLLGDPRSDEFVAAFLHQWLDMVRLDFFQFDTTLYREYDDATRTASRREVYESFAHLMRHPSEGQLGKLLKSDYVIINGLLGSYYGLEGVSGEAFRKVKLPQGSPRGGLLGMAAIHAMGSDGIVSSPVERGAWVLRHILNEPPPPAPPNVPQLSAVQGKNLTTREKLLAHQEQPQCASCHRKIDPIGFGLENFDAAGKWRVEEHQIKSGKKNRSKVGPGHKIDPSGSFYGGPAFANFFEMRDRIAEREEDFARGFTEHLIEYALGRPYGFTDEDLTNQILTASKDKQYAVSEFIHALVQSKAFRTK